MIGAGHVVRVGWK